MKYARDRTGLAVEVKEWYDALRPERYVVVSFDEGFDGKVELTPDAEMDQVHGNSVPLRFIADDFEVVYRTKGWNTEEYYRAQMAGDLLAEYGELDECGENCVPMEMAIRQDNRPIVAMYMFVYQKMSYEKIADRLGVKIETVKRYRRRVST